MFSCELSLPASPCTSAHIFNTLGINRNRNISPIPALEQWLSHWGLNLHFPVSYGLSIFHVYGPAGVPLLWSVCSDVLPILLLDNLLNICNLFFMWVCVCIYPPICALPFHLHNNVFNAQMFFILMLSSTVDHWTT